ncbi:MAG: hypothetical protein HOC78_03425 [Candidatus Komeilibacteria bacterium]|jgi:hypothetical protein|nr:hypothetical protein [Candidatus Komeilibacteria bacterium]
MFGLILVILGILFLFEEMDIIQGDFWGYFWPVILIVLGLNMIKKDKNGVNCCGFFGTKKHKSNNKEHKVVDEQ